jgi:hypothetical protein
MQITTSIQQKISAKSEIKEQRNPLFETNRDSKAQQ